VHIPYFMMRSFTPTALYRIFRRTQGERRRSEKTLRKGVKAGSKLVGFALLTAPVAISAREEKA
jgi:hypothetical protein